MTNNGEIFLQQIFNRISHLPKSEIDKAISYYRESLEDKLEDGLTESVAINSFGTIDEIVASIEEEVSLGAIVKDRVRIKRDKSSNNKYLTFIFLVISFPIWFPILIFILSMLFSITIIILTIPIIICSLYFVLLILSGSSVIMGLIRIFTISIATGVFYVGIGFIIAGIAIMLYRPLIMLMKFMFEISIIPLKKLKQFLIKR